MHGSTTHLTLDGFPQLFQRSTGAYMSFDHAELRVRAKSCIAPACDYK